MTENRGFDTLDLHIWKLSEPFGYFIPFMQVVTRDKVYSILTDLWKNWVFKCCCEML